MRTYGEYTMARWIPLLLLVLCQLSIGNTLYGQTIFEKECLKQSPAGIALRDHITLAKSGNVQSMFCAGAIHLYIERDVNNAVPWLERSANRGHRDAPLVLGILYEKGTGVPEDHSRAAKWYQSGVDNGNVAAMRRLAEMYRLGLGVPRDENKARALLSRAGQLGDKAAPIIEDRRRQSRLQPKPTDDVKTEAYSLYRQKRYAEAMNLYKKCAQAGNDDCELALGNLHEYGLGVPQDHKQAAMWYRKSADKGNAIAQKSLGLMYELGKGVTENWGEAARLYGRSAETFGDGAFNLARMYEFGMGVPQNRDAAIFWFKKAADLGHPQGNYWVRWLSNFMNCIGFRNEQEQRTLGFLRCPADPVGVVFRNSTERYAYLRTKAKEFDRLEAIAAWQTRKNEYDKCEREKKYPCYDPGAEPR
jgi:TPR repeat protein